MSNLSSMLSDLASAIDSGQFGGGIHLPAGAEAACGPVAGFLRGLGEFVAVADANADMGFSIMNRLDAIERQVIQRDAQMSLTFDGEREQLKAIIEAQSKQLMDITHTLREGLRRLDAPPANLAAAYEVLATLRATPADGAPREVVDALRDLDVALSTEHVEMAGRKMELLRRVVEEADDFLDNVDHDEAGTTQSLREALADLRDGP